MVEFDLDEWKKVVVHELNKWELDDLLRLHVIGSTSGGIGRPFLWANGVIFEHNNMPSTPDIIRDQLKGIIHWSSLQFAFMPVYKEEIVISTVSLHIGDVSSNNLFSQMAEWLKKNYK